MGTGYVGGERGPTGPHPERHDLPKMERVMQIQTFSPSRPAPTRQATTPEEPAKDSVDLDWKAIAGAALKGAGVGAASSTMGAVARELRVPASGVRYAGVATAAVVSTRTAERVFNNVRQGESAIRQTNAVLLPKAAALGAVGFAAGAVGGGLAGTLGGLAGATGGLVGVAVATVAGAALAGGVEILRQRSAS